jgi:hypothetical protein
LFADRVDVEVRVSDTATLRGQVVTAPSPGGEAVPVEGVELQLVHPDPDEMGARFRRIVSGADGRFTSPPIQVGTSYRVRVLGVPPGLHLAPVVATTTFCVRACCWTSPARSRSMFGCPDPRPRSPER